MKKGVFILCAMSPSQHCFTALFVCPSSYINGRFTDRLTPKLLLPAMKNARFNAYPDEPQNLAELGSILQCERYKSLSAVSQFKDSIYGGSAKGEDGSCSVLFITKRCVDFMKTAPFIYAFSFPLNVGMVRFLVLYIIF